MKQRPDFKDRYKSWRQKIDDYKTSPQYRQDQFYNKARLKLTLIISPALIIGLILVQKFTDIEGYILYIVPAFLLTTMVNLGAQILTRNHFKNKNE